MNHAIKILVEEKCKLRSLIRTINRDMHEIMPPLAFSQVQEELKQLEAAIAILIEEEAANG